MTEAAMVRMIVDGVVILAGACLFVRFLCDEYTRTLEVFGLIRRRGADDGASHAQELNAQSAGTRR